MRKPKSIRRQIASDLIGAIYTAEGWQPHDRAGFNTCVARCNWLYVITADPKSNRFIATRREEDTPA